MSRANAFDFMLRAVDLTQNDTMRSYRNEDYVVHYDAIHPRVGLLSRWPFRPVIAAWRAHLERRHLRLAISRLASLSEHLLADINFAMPQDSAIRTMPFRPAAMPEIAGSDTRPTVAAIAVSAEPGAIMISLPNPAPAPKIAPAVTANESLAA